MCEPAGRRGANQGVHNHRTLLPFPNPTLLMGDRALFQEVTMLINRLRLVDDTKDLKDLTAHVCAIGLLAVVGMCLLAPVVLCLAH